MSDSIDRRAFLGTAAAGVLAITEPPGRSDALEMAPVAGHVPKEPGGEPEQYRYPSLITDAAKFVDVSRGKPIPSTLKGEALAKARLTAETWRLEIISDGSSELARPASVENQSAIDLPALKELGRRKGVKILKAMQCNNIPIPLGQGLWEGVPLRDVLEHVGNVANVRRVYYWGFHNNDPAQVFQSSLSYNRVMETPPWEPPPIVAYRLNGGDIPLKRGGPVRMLVPWAHGFKSVKWLQRIVLTNDYKANDTYALQNNDPESYLKTAAYLTRGSRSFKAGEPLVIEGTAMVGWSGLKRVEYWLRAGAGASTDKTLDAADPLWRTAEWKPCAIMAPPADWKSLLPGDTAPGDVWGFDGDTGRPRQWPLLFSTIPWSVTLKGLAPGPYEFRARTVDLNGFAQPEPRPYQKSGLNRVPCETIVVTG